MLVKVSVVLVLCQLFSYSQAAAIPQATSCSMMYESCQTREDCCSNNQICLNEMCSTVSDPIGPPISLIGKSVIIPEDPGCGLTDDSCKNMSCCATFFCNTDLICEEESWVPVGGYGYTGVGDQSVGVGGVPGGSPQGVGGNPDPYGYPGGSPQGVGGNPDPYGYPGGSPQGVGGNPDPYGYPYGGGIGGPPPSN